MAFLKQEKFTFDTRKEAKAEATRIGLRSGEYEIAREDGGYFIVWLRKGQVR